MTWSHALPPTALNARVRSGDRCVLPPLQEPWSPHDESSTSWRSARSQELGGASFTPKLTRTREVTAVQLIALPALLAPASCSMACGLAGHGPWTILCQPSPGVCGSEKESRFRLAATADERQVPPLSTTGGRPSARGKCVCAGSGPMSANAYSIQTWIWCEPARESAAANDES